MEGNYRQLLRGIINQYYFSFEKKERKMIWLSAFAPSEIVKSFDVNIFYPESHAAVLSVRKVRDELISKATSVGYNESICSYMKIFSSALSYKRTLPFGKIPKPDALIVTNNQCDTLFFMWRIFAKCYNVPLYVIDFPASINRDIRNDYILSQIRNLINFMEGVTNKKLDMGELKKRVANSSKTSALWGKMCDFTFKEKLDISINSLTNNFFFPVVCAHSEPKTVKFLENSLKQLGKNKKENDECKKIYWFGYPFWFANEKFPDLSEMGGRIIANNYLKWWDIPVDASKPPTEALIEGYTNTYLNQSLECKIFELQKDVKRYNIDGVIVHSNFSCKRDSIVSKKVVDELANKSIPAIEIQGDMCDKNKFQEKQFLLRAEAFLESL